VPGEKTHLNKSRVEQRTFLKRDVESAKKRAKRKEEEKDARGGTHKDDLRASATYLALDSF
jgi:hypothetical protein